MARRILVVEDEAPIREMVCFVLEQNGFQPVEAEDYDSAVNKLNEPWPDLILLDWMLPGGSGLQFIKHLKREAMTRDIPVVMLTARGEEEDRVRGLETGADDYITKPFSPKELVARIKAVMRRISPMAVEEVIEMQGLSLDPGSHRVMTGDSPLDMGPTEFKLLHFFMTHPERVYSREQLLNHVWGTNVYVEDRTVDVHIRRLRKALEHSGHDRMVQTVRGTGYRFRPAFNAFSASRTQVSGGEGFPFLREYDACWNGCHGKGWCWSWCSVASPRLSLALFWLSAVVFTGGGDGTACLAFLEFVTPLLVALGRQKYDAAAGTGKLGTAVIRFTPDAVAK